MSSHHQLFKYLQRKQNRSRIDQLMTVAAIIHPLMGTPQIVKVYTMHQAAGLSIWTWAGWLLLGLVFMVYGIAHKLTPYIFMQMLWLVVDILMIIGIILYG